MRRFGLEVIVLGPACILSGCTGEGGQSRPEEAVEQAVQEGLLASGPEVQLFYRAVGAGSDTVVVIHGGPGFSMDYFAADLEPLAEHVTLIFYDQRGMGRSTLVSDSAQLAASWFVEDLDAVRSHFELERMTVLGHSWGAGVAALYAIRYPERLDRIVIASGIPLRRALLADGFQKMQASRDSSEIREMDELFRVRLADPGDADACREYYVRWYRPFFGDSSAAGRSRGDFCAGAAEAWRNKMENVDRFTMASLGDWDWRDSLRDLDVPTLVVHGTADPIPFEGAREWATTLPNARLLIIDGMGHFPYLEAPDRFFPAVVEFASGGWPAAAEEVGDP